MTGSQTDRMIMALEHLNRERIQAVNNDIVSAALRMQRIKTEIRSRKAGELVNHVLIRGFRKKIHTKAASQNLEYGEELNMARHGSPGIRVAVYSCIAGSYDLPRAPFYMFDNCDYLMFTDQLSVTGWENCKMPERVMEWKDTAMRNRYMKFHPFKFLAGRYDYSVYLDGNITPVSDLSVLTERVDPEIGLAFHRHCSRSSLEEELTACMNLKKGNSYYLRRQADAYRSEGLPDDYGLVEGNVIVTDLHSRTAKKLMDSCWQELVRSKGKRDQIVWPYVLWKAGIPVSKVCTLGNNVWLNPKLYISNHVNQRDRLE